MVSAVLRSLGRSKYRCRTLLDCNLFGQKSCSLSNPFGFQQRLASYKVAIVGSGPSGCYTAKYLQSGFTKRESDDVKIDVIERLPIPYGLVRYGVAPDHPEVKNVQNDFDALFKDKGIQFYGNVHVGRDISVDELRKMYDIVVLSYGCESDRKLNIPGEELEGVLSAREFVAWYNGHPDYLHIGEKVGKVLRGSTDEVRSASVVVIGQGNVALDCARILAKGGNGLYDTDIASHSLPILGDGVSNVSIVGRRGHVQGAFTIKELRELMKLEKEGHNVSFTVSKDELELGETAASMEELNGPQGRPKTRINKLLHEAASKAPNLDLPKNVNLRFLLSPSKFESSHGDSNALGAIICERTCLEGDSGHQRAVGTGEYEKLAADLALVSIGYKGVAVPGTEAWFDGDRGILINQNGLVDMPTKAFGGLYVAGWLKRGPSGIIGTNIGDAKDTVGTIFENLNDMKTKENGSRQDSLQSLLETRGVEFVDWDGYQRIEKTENDRRRSDSQPREKITKVNEMLIAARL